MTEITAADLQQKFGQLKEELEHVAGAARSTAQKAGVVAGVLLVLLAFFLGSRSAGPVKPSSKSVDSERLL